MITRQFERAFFSLHEGQGTNNEDSEFDSEGLRYSTFSFLSLLSSQMIVQQSLLKDYQTLENVYDCQIPNPRY